LALLNSFIFFNSIWTKENYFPQLSVFLEFGSLTFIACIIIIGVVYGICDKDGAWPYRKERKSSEEFYFGLKTAQGLLEFKCESKFHKQKWVDGIGCLLRRVNSVETTKLSLDLLSINSDT